MIDIPEGVHRVRKCLVRLGEARWPFANREEASIRVHWARRQAENPRFFNGGVHIMTGGRLRDGCLEGALVATDFAASLYWRETGFRDGSVVDCFGSAIFIGSDGALIYARQTPGQINTGKIYPPGGFLDKGDLDGAGFADFDGSIAREVQEEMGLDAGFLRREPGYVVTRDGPFLSVGIVYGVGVTGEAFCKAVNEQLARCAAPELESLIALHSPDDANRHAMFGYARKIALAMLK